MFSSSLNDLIYMNDVSGVENYLKNGGNPEQKNDNDHHYPLAYAFIQNHYEIISLLFSYNASANIPYKGYLGDTFPLIELIIRNQEKNLTRLFILQGAHVSTKFVCPEDMSETIEKAQNLHKELEGLRANLLLTPEKSVETYQALQTFWLRVAATERNNYEAKEPIGNFKRHYENLAEQAKIASEIEQAKKLQTLSDKAGTSSNTGIFATIASWWNSTSPASPPNNTVVSEYKPPRPKLINSHHHTD